MMRERPARANRIHDDDATATRKSWTYLQSRRVSSCWRWCRRRCPRYCWPIDQRRCHQCWCWSQSLDRGCRVRDVRWGLAASRSSLREIRRVLGEEATRKVRHHGCHESKRKEKDLPEAPAVLVLLLLEPKPPKVDWVLLVPKPPKPPDPNDMLKGPSWGARGCGQMQASNGRRNARAMGRGGGGGRGQVRVR